MAIKKLLFIIPSLSIGGSERFIINLMNHLDHKLFDINLLVLTSAPNGMEKLIRKDIKIKFLEKRKTLHAFFSIIKELKTLKPDLTFSTIGHLNLLLGLIRYLFVKDLKIVARESSLPSYVNSVTKSHIGYNALYRITYPGFSHIVCQSKPMFDDLIKLASIDPGKINVINNFFDRELLKDDSIIPEEYLPFQSKKVLVFVGRLEKIKRIDLLLLALKKAQNQNIHLFVIGSGGQRLFLEEFSKQLGLESQVTFLGSKGSPYPYIRHASFSCITSEVEGFPNSILESLALGTPIIGFNSFGGLAEMATRENSLLTSFGDVDGLANILNKANRESFNSPGIKKSAIEKFSPEVIIPMYQKLFLRL